MVDEKLPQQLLGQDLLDRDGNRVGEITEVFVDERTLEPTWVTATTGWFGISQSFVPLDRVQWRGDELWAAYDTATIKDAPRFAPDQPLNAQDEDLLHEHYRLSAPAIPTQYRPEPGQGPDGTTEHSPARIADSPRRLRRYDPRSESPVPAGGEPRGPAGCGLCGALIAPDMHALHEEFHRSVGRSPGGFARHDIEVTEPPPA